MNTITNSSVPANSPAGAQMNEVIKNVATMNNKVGGKRKTRKNKNRGKSRKNYRKGRKGSRRSH